MDPTADHRSHPWMGVFAATLCPFKPDESIDEQALADYLAELAMVPGLRGLVVNGHTGEIMSLRPEERALATRIAAQAVRKHNPAVKVISGVSAEGSLEAIDHARAAREAGADAILLMPPHHWLRFGRSPQTAVGFIQDVASAGAPICLHQYPAWCKASYSLDEMLQMVKLPELVCIKMGTRDMSRWLWDYERIKAAAPHVSVITCHDEYLMPTLLEAGDGALIGFAGFAPELMVELVHACLAGDLARAKQAQRTVAPLARLIYNFGEPGCGAHQRMKVARWIMGKFASPAFRRPVRPLTETQTQAIRDGLAAIGYPVVR